MSRTKQTARKSHSAAPVPFSGRDTVQPGPASPTPPEARMFKKTNVISGVTKANAAITRGATQVRKILKRKPKITFTKPGFKNH